MCRTHWFPRGKRTGSSVHARYRTRDLRGADPRLVRTNAAPVDGRRTPNGPRWAASASKRGLFAGKQRRFGHRAETLTPRPTKPQIHPARTLVDGTWTWRAKRSGTQGAHLQAKTMARAGIEPATPRFSGTRGFGLQQHKFPVNRDCHPTHALLGYRWMRADIGGFGPERRLGGQNPYRAGASRRGLPRASRGSATCCRGVPLVIDYHGREETRREGPRAGGQLASRTVERLVSLTEGA